MVGTKVAAIMLAMVGVVVMANVAMGDITVRKVKTQAVMVPPDRNPLREWQVNAFTEPSMEPGFSYILNADVFGQPVEVCR